MSVQEIVEAIHGLTADEAKVVRDDLEQLLGGTPAVPQEESAPDPAPAPDLESVPPAGDGAADPPPPARPAIS